MSVRERALQFGPGGRLLGMLSLPAEIDPELPALLIPNTGFEHRIGPHRLHVHLARAFAAEGFVCLRLDLSGLGDSATSAQGDAIAELRAAMDALERQQLARRCIPVGLCSGGHDAHRYAVSDARVAGAAFLDHYLYHTPRSRRIHLAQRLAEPRRLLNFVERLRNGTGSGEAQEAEYFRQPSPQRFREDLAGFMRRGMPLFFLFTGEYQNTYNYPDQLLDVCPKLGEYERYDLHYFAEADHTFSQQRMREQLLEALRMWLAQQVRPRFGAQRPAPPRGVDQPPSPLAAMASALSTAPSTKLTRPTPSVPPNHAAAVFAESLSGVTEAAP